MADELDDAGRAVAPAQERYERPTGPWDTNTSSQPVLHTVCAWCPDFNPVTSDRNVSHGMCAACMERLNKQLEVSRGR